MLLCIENLPVTLSQDTSGGVVVVGGGVVGVGDGDEKMLELEEARTTCDEDENLLKFSSGWVDETGISIPTLTETEGAVISKDDVIDSLAEVDVLGVLIVFDGEMHSTVRLQYN